MTKFQRDMMEAIDGGYIEVITRRQAELREIEYEGKRCKNSFKVKCLAQEFARLNRELDAIMEAV